MRIRATNTRIPAFPESTVHKRDRGTFPLESRTKVRSRRQTIKRLDDGSRECAVRPTAPHRRANPPGDFNPYHIWFASASRGPPAAAAGGPTFQLVAIGS